MDEQTELPEDTQREAELQRQLYGLQSQVTELHRADITQITLRSDLYSLK